MILPNCSRNISTFEFWTTTKCAVNTLKLKLRCSTIVSINDAIRMANSDGPDQTATLGAVCFWSALFAQTCLSESLGSLQIWTVSR